jgi:uncharacterized membrane protein YhaH (DUF805 family)
MSFGDAVRTCFSKYADGKGRANRPEYWWFFLSYIIVYFVAAIIGGALDASWLVWIPLVVYIVPLIAAAVRRLHDTGRPGPNQYGPPPGMATLPGAGAPPPPPPPA